MAYPSRIGFLFRKDHSTSCCATTAHSPPARWSATNTSHQASRSCLNRFTSADRGGLFGRRAAPVRGMPELSKIGEATNVWLGTIVYLADDYRLASANSRA